MKNDVSIKETAKIALGALICLAIMLGIYFAVGKFTLKALYGGLLGTALNIANFFFMALGVTSASKNENTLKMQAGVRASFLIRMIVMVAILVFALKSGIFDPLATLLPLCFTRLIILVEELFGKALKKQ